MHYSIPFLDGQVLLESHNMGLCSAVSVAKEQQKDGEVFHLLCQKGVDIVRQKVGGEKVLPPCKLL